MQKNDRYYAFLFTHSSRNRILIRRVEVSKKVLRSCAAASLIGISATAFTISNSIKLPNSFFTEASTASIQEPNSVNKTFDWVKSVVNKVSVENKSAQQSVTEQPQVTEIAQVNKPSYANAEPTSAVNPLNSTINSGGPSMPFQLTNESAEEENQIAQELDYLQKTLDPSYLPTMWAHLGKINNEYGFRRNPFGGRSYEFHGGLDIDGDRGDIVVAPANGTILKAGWVSGYGNLIEISHGGGLTTRYGHLSKVLIKVGDTIERGQEIGLVGSTGRSTGPHLHYELRLNNKTINPRRFLPSEPTEIRALAEK